MPLAVGTLTINAPLLEETCLSLDIDHVNGSATLTKEKYYICQEVSVWPICIFASLHSHLPDSTHYATKTFMAQLEKVRAKPEGKGSMGIQH